LPWRRRGCSAHLWAHRRCVRPRIHMPLRQVGQRLVLLRVRRLPVLQRRRLFRASLALGPGRWSHSHRRRPTTVCHRDEADSQSSKTSRKRLHRRRLPVAAALVVVPLRRRIVRRRSTPCHRAPTAWSTRAFCLRHQGQSPIRTWPCIRSSKKRTTSWASYSKSGRRSFTRS